jgi:hypothetical protein
MSKIIFSIFLLFISTSFSQTTISGSIGGKTFTPAGNPWIVTENIIIEKEKTVKINAGCVFLFKQFTGMEVSGKLIVDGSTESPVVFTSFNDNKFNLSAEVLPNPFDWNGIVINAGANEIRFSHIFLSFSVFGIKSQKTDFFIKSGTFRQNGQFHFTVLGEIQPVQEGYPFDYGNKTDEKQERTVRPLRIAAITTGSAGLICGVVSGIFWNNYRKAWHDAEYSTKSIEIEDANDREEKSLKNAGIMTGISVTLLSTAAVLYVFDQNHNKKNEVSFFPVFGSEYTGIVLNYNF